ncbi:MAG: AbgT family transporter [Pseudomonadales bacterium]|nr:AbgT family transporter [Pseudomonadales bacterium]
MGSASAKWALLAPVLVPMLMRWCGPEMSARRLSRSGRWRRNIITPLMPLFPADSDVRAAWRRVWPGQPRRRDDPLFRLAAPRKLSAPSWWSMYGSCWGCRAGAGGRGPGICAVWSASCRNKRPPLRCVRWGSCTQRELS